MLVICGTTRRFALLIVNPTIHDSPPIHKRNLRPHPPTWAIPGCKIQRRYKNDTYIIMMRWGVGWGQCPPTAARPDPDNTGTDRGRTGRPRGPPTGGTRGPTRARGTTTPGTPGARPPQPLVFTPSTTPPLVGTASVHYRTPPPVVVGAGRPPTHGGRRGDPDSHRRIWFLIGGYGIREATYGIP